jgi:hypothetical protein
MTLAVLHFLAQKFLGYNLLHKGMGFYLSTAGGTLGSIALAASFGIRLAWPRPPARQLILLGYFIFECVNGHERTNASVQQIAAKRHCD